jgi:hypothetical protein
VLPLSYSAATFAGSQQCQIVSDSVLKQRLPELNADAPEGMKLKSKSQLAYSIIRVAILTSPARLALL